MPVEKADFKVGQVIRVGPLSFPLTQHKFWKIKYRRYFTYNPGIPQEFSTAFPQWAYILETGGAHDTGTGWYPQSALLTLTEREATGMVVVEKPDKKKH